MLFDLFKAFVPSYICEYKAELFIKILYMKRRDKTVKYIYQKLKKVLNDFLYKAFLYAEMLL